MSGRAQGSGEASSVTAIADESGPVSGSGPGCVRIGLRDEVVPVCPGDDAGAERVELWLQAFAVSRDPALRERIVLAYLGLADRLADRYRSSRGATREDLAQTARAALVAAVDR
jgi:hypothetical protein